METVKRGLGRGLAALIPVRREREESGAEEILRIPISEIVPNRHQPRKFFDEEKIAELAESIREKGILQPLIVSRRDGRFELISGERRLRAAALAGLDTVPAILRDGGTSESLEIALIENLQREDLDPIEAARAFEELIEKFGHTQEAVAAKVGKDRTTVANSLRLLRLPLKIREELQAGRITVGHARALLGVPEIERQLYFLDRLVQAGWSVRELESRVASRGGRRGRRRGDPAKSLSLALVSLLDQLRRRLGTQVRLVPSGDKGKIIIEYYSQSDLDRIFKTLVK